MINTFTAASIFMQTVWRQRRNALLNGSFSLRPEIKKEMVLSSIESTDLIVQEAKADKIAIFTSSFPSVKVSFTS